MLDNITFSEYIRGIIPKQYNYTNLSDFVDRKAQFIDSKIGDIQEKLINDIYDIDTCTSTALRNYWGSLYNVNPYVTNKNTGAQHVLTDDEYRIAVKMKAFESCWDGTTYQLDAFITKCFRDRGRVFCADAGKMVMVYTFLFRLDDWEYNLYTNYDILPRNAGCGTEVNYLSEEVFGFNGSELHPFNQRPFQSYNK